LTVAARGGIASSADSPGTDAPSEADGGESVDPVASPPAADGRRYRHLGVWIAILVYVALGVVAILPSWLGGASHTLQCGGCGDNGQEVWFLAWGSHALTHLVNPFRTNWIDFPYGVDLADNTSMPMAGFIGAPITLIFGPIATYNVLLTLAFASSATTCMLACRRWASTPAAFVGGLLYGFSPYMVGQGAGHLFLLFVPIPPLLLLLLDEMLVRQRFRWWIVGLLFALLEIIQLGFSAEIFAETALMMAIGLVLFAFSQRRRFRPKLGYALRAIILGAVPVIPFALLFAYEARTGPNHAKGPVHPIRLLAGLSTDLAGLVVPTANQRYPFGSSALGSRWVAMTPAHGIVPDVTENGAFIGIPLLLLLCLGVWKYRRIPVVQFSALMAAAGLVMSMGSRLHVAGHMTPIRLPFAVLTHLPFLDSEVASRYSLFMWLFVAVLISIIADRWLFSRRRRPAHGRSGASAVTSRALPAVLLAAGLVSLIPNWPYAIQQIAVPTWFTSVAAKEVPLGSTLLPYPFASGQSNLPELWQALDDFRFRMPTGEAAVPVTRTGAIGRALSSCFENPDESQPRHLSLDLARKELVAWQVRTIVIPIPSNNDACAIRYMTLVMGAPPQQQYSAAVWRLTAQGAIVPTRPVDSLAEP
jgi:hypothetical protein